MSCPSPRASTRFSSSPALAFAPFLSFTPLLVIQAHRLPRLPPPRRRPTRLRPAASQHDPSVPGYRPVPPPSWAGPADVAGAASFLQCVACRAVYAVEIEELEGEPRVVRCCGCLHEWYARDSDLLWGDREAAAAIEIERLEQMKVREEKASAREREGEEKTVQKKSKPEGARWEAGTGFGNQSRAKAVGVEIISAATGVGRKERVVDDSALPPAESIQPPPRVRNGVENLGDGSKLRVVFCGNLSFRATEEDLFVAFSGYGVLVKCQIPTDGNGSSRGYGFIEFANEADADVAIHCLQGISILGRDVSLSKARPKSHDSSPRGGRGYFRNGDKKDDRGGGDSNGHRRGDDGKVR